MTGREKRVRGGKAASARAERLCTRIINRKSSIVNPSGFTLIELLVVISVVALLMAVLLPTLSRARKQARTVACQAKLRQWGLVFSMYIDDSDSQYPLEEIGWTTGVWHRLLRPYCSDSNDMLLCPMATRYEDNENDPYHPPLSERSDGFGVGSKYTAWKAAFLVEKGQAWRRSYYGSYGINVWLVHDRKYPAQAPALLDCAAEGVFPSSTHAPPAFDGQLRGPPGAMSYVCIDRHQGAINALFWDRTVRKVGLKELWTLKWFSLYDTRGPWTKAGGVNPEEWAAWMRGFKDY